MQIDGYVQALREDLARVAAVGDESTARAAELLAVALESALGRRLLEALQDRYPQGLTLLPSSAKLGGPWGSFQYSSFVGPSNSITC